VGIDEDTAAWVELGLVSGLGPVAFRELLAAFGAPAAILGAAVERVSRVVGAELAGRIAAGERELDVQRALEWLGKPRHHLITLADQAYPRQLLEIFDAPPLLYLNGDPAVLTRPAIAIVGARNATPQGRSNAAEFARALTAAGLLVVSGMALGADSAAHEGALEGGGATIAVLGTGVDVVYPRRNAELAARIATHGALLSEFALGAPPVAGHFPRRNRIISGLARGCLVVEAAVSSGSLITAKSALEQGREVFAIPGSIHSPLSRGCHSLIKSGAKLVESAEDVLSELGIPSAARVPKGLSSVGGLLQYMGYEACDADSIMRRSGLTADAVSAMLLQLELEGRVGSLPGGL
jgi:DNA processing protein